MIHITFIVSSCDRPIELMGCIASLLMQNVEKQIIICDNSDNAENIHFIQNLCKMHPCIQYVDTNEVSLEEDGSTKFGCYKSANFVMNFVKGEYVCFPSDDSYYVPGFSETMLEYAKQFKFNLVYCDMIYDPRFNQKCYQHVSAAPMHRFIDKTNFIIKTEEWPGFPLIDPAKDDYLAIERLVEREVLHGHAPGIMVFHN